MTGRDRHKHCASRNSTRIADYTTGLGWALIMLALFIIGRCTG